ncbi:efflux RND transporter permease subunit [Halorhodospira halophila]|uniref:efflux RND transporter permease subunit n=1 Tax=Halorhodospira halophila TaxID=1053 RepID=UPI001911C1CA|nr:efflux RND transporter permease subunit [Halorhodospira halophila]MBK5936196.1 multidrug transporter AcrB [Halorhodospira halophila]
MILSDIAIRRPVLATVASVLIVVLGIASLAQLPVREYPDIDPPVVSIETRYTGAAPAVIDTEITELIESAVSSVDGIRSMTSESRDGRGETDIEFEVGRDIDAAANDVRDAIGRILDDLPADADPPVVAKTEADARPMMWLSLSSSRMSPEEMTDYADRHLVDRLSVLDGVARVRIGGERRYAMRIWLDSEALAARALTVEDVENALRRENIELPAGEIESVARQLTVRTDTRLRDRDDFARLVIERRGDELVRLGEVARVERGVEDDDTAVRLDGETAVGLGIIRQSRANTIAVADAVLAEMARLEDQLPADLRLVVGYDESQFVRQSIREVVRTLLIAVGLVVLTIFVFLRSLRATLIPSVTIPVAVIGAFIVMGPLGFSLNVLTLLALILAIGLVVDDAIVVLENIQRRIDEGEPPLLAAYRGVRQVGFAVIATTISLVAVFVPIAFMEGNVGRLFTEFGLVLAAAVVFSSFVALTLTGMLCSKWLRPRAAQPGGLEAVAERFFTGLTGGYRRALGGALQAPIAVLGVGVAAAVGAYALYQALPQELTPTEDRGVFIVPASAPEGSTAAHTDAGVRELEEILRPLREETGEARRVLSILGFGGRANSAFIIVGLEDWGDRSRSQQQIVAETMPRLMGVPGVRAFAVNPPGLGQSGFQQPVQFVVGGTDYDEVAGWTERILARAQDENPRLVNLDSSYDATRPQLNVRIDRDRAADLGVSAEALGGTVQTLLASRTVTAYLDRGREYDVMLQAEAVDRRNPGDLDRLHVRSLNDGALIPLSALVTLEEEGAPPALSRVDRLPAVTLTASLAPGYDLGAALAYLEQVAAEELPATARISYLGLSDEFKRAGGAVFLTFGLALLIVFLVLSAQFESFVHPLIIMTAVPLAITGALGALLLGGSSLNIYSQIGMILLIGLMTKNGILIVEFANQLRDQGYSVREAIHAGAVLRFRPVLMTAISTVFGAVPLVLALGAGAESRAAIGTVIIGGMGFATLLTLFVIPVLYDWLARYTTPVNVVGAELERLERAHGAPRARE